MGFSWLIDGETLDDTTGLLNESQFAKESGLSAVNRYRNQGLIKPVGQAISSGSGIANFYHPRQIKELKNALGITLNLHNGLAERKAICEGIRFQPNRRVPKAGAGSNRWDKR